MTHREGYPNLFHHPDEDIIGHGDGIGSAPGGTLGPEEMERINEAVESMSDAELDNHVANIANGTNKPL